MTAPPVLLALVDRHGAVVTFTSTDAMVRHVTAIPGWVAERCQIATYELAAVRDVLPGNGSRYERATEDGD